jgi:hypothetical protein
LSVSKSFANLLGWNPDRLVGVTAPELMPKGKYKAESFETE